jgi:hypothetical protein
MHRLLETPEKEIERAFSSGSYIVRSAMRSWERILMKSRYGICKRADYRAGKVEEMLIHGFLKF